MSELGIIKKYEFSWRTSLILIEKFDLGLSLLYDNIITIRYIDCGRKHIWNIAKD